MSGTTFVAAAVAYGKLIAKALDAGESKNQAAARFYAIGYLAKMTKKDINAKGREASGLTEDTWNSDKVTLSKCHRSIAGEYGFGEKLALMWAAGDFSVSLDKAYSLSGGPRKEVDSVASLAKKLASMSASEVQEVLAQYVEIAHTMALNFNDIQANVKESWQELVRVA